jgi:hypothetical protein
MAPSPEGWGRNAPLLREAGADLIIDADPAPKKKAGVRDAERNQEGDRRFHPDDHGGVPAKHHIELVDAEQYRSYGDGKGRRSPKMRSVSNHPPCFPPSTSSMWGPRGTLPGSWQAPVHVGPTDPLMIRVPQLARRSRAKRTRQRVGAAHEGVAALLRGKEATLARVPPS